MMKESELARADADYNRRLTEIQRAANGADILSVPIVFGTLVVTKGGL